MATDFDRESWLQLLRESHTIAVIGLSDKPNRPAYRVAAYLQQAGYRIVPVHPIAREVLGEPAYPSLEAIPATLPVDIVDVFRRAEDTPPIAEAAVGIRARGLWLQSGIFNEEAMAVARRGGLVVAQGVCLMVEHRALFSS